MLNITLDSGATVSYLRLDKAKQLGLAIYPNNQFALLADMRTRMESLGEVDFLVTIEGIQLRLRALVMENLQTECFGGTTFHVDNDVSTRLKEGIILLHGQFQIKQSNPHSSIPIYPPPLKLSPHTAGKVQSLPRYNAPKNHLQNQTTTRKFNAISLPFETVIYPGEVLPIPVQDDPPAPGYISISPSFPDAYDNRQWAPQICQVIDREALFTNYSDRPLLVQKHSHFRPHPISIARLSDLSSDCNQSNDPGDMPSKMCYSLFSAPTVDPLSSIQINTSVISEVQHERLTLIHKNYCEVFNNDLRNGYNHKAGQFFAEFTFINKPPPTRIYSPQYNKKCADLQQAKCDELESQGVLVDPKVHGIPILHVSPSWIQQKGRAKHKNLQDCTLDELRFITAFNTLNDSIRPKPTTSCSATTIFMFLARWKYHIFGDLNNSYFQLPVRKRLWGYLGIQTPYKGVRVMTRTGQGLLGSDVELGELLSRVLGQEISAGFCVALRDDIIIGGKNQEDAINNYEAVLVKLHSCNLKLSPHKVRIFPSDTEVYGYRVKEGCILPSNHTITSLGKTTTEALTTNKHVNSWKGLYKTLIGHLPGLSSVMSPFDSATAGKNSNEKFVWTPPLISAFNKAMSHLKQVNKTYLPRPNEQLILLPDAMSAEPCIGWVLYVIRDNRSLPVMFCTAKLKEYMSKWFPCEKEAIGVVISIDQCSHWISESHLPTLVGPDCLSVVKAADLIRRGKHSSNPRLQSLLASINRRNIKFFHNSAKAGLHRVPDHLSRMKDKTCNSKDCAVERFLDDIPVHIQAMQINCLDPDPDITSLCFLDHLPSPTVIAATSQDLEDRLLKTSGPIPLGSRRTWMDIQKTDMDCHAVYNMKIFGEAPRKKNSNTHRNKIFKESIIDKGLLVVRAFDERKMRQVDRIVVPPTFLDSILSVLHIKLNHPRQSQLKQVFNRYFFSPRTDKALSKLYETCHLCISFSQFPKQLESYNPTQFPSHPGTVMNIDIMKRAGQTIVINTDLFSSYTTTCLSSSEKADDLAKAIIQVTTPIRRGASLLIRVDKAPGFVSLASTPDSSLSELGIKLELGDDGNKNSNCSVDRIIKELEEELKKLSPDCEKISSTELAQATMILNNKIRKRNLTASEIHFSRDAHDNSNLFLCDKQLQEQQKKLRLQNNEYLMKSRNSRSAPNPQSDLSQGDVVFMDNTGSKHLAKSPHIVINTDSSNKVILKKTLFTSPFTSKSVNISPFTKTVDKKFIYKPPFKHHQQTLTSGDDDSSVSDTSVLEASPCETWTPLSFDNEPNLIPLVNQSIDDPPAVDLIGTSQATAVINSPEDQSLEELQLELNLSHPSTSPNSSSSYYHDTSAVPSPSDSTNDSANSESSVIRMLTNDDPPHLQEKLLQNRKPKVNERIAFYSDEKQAWVEATITHDLSRRWANYFNIVYDDGIKGGLYLTPDTRWTFLSDVDGNLLIPDEMRLTSAPMSLQPTPNSSITREQTPFLNVDELSSCDSPNSVALNSSHPSTSTGTLDKSRNESMDWDLSYLDLAPSPPPPSPKMRQPMSLLQVQNLDAVLPLCSTPAPTRRHVSAPRQPLPREHQSTNQPSSSSFFQRINPFKKNSRR